MKQQLEQRLQQLKAEFASGQKVLLREIGEAHAQQDPSFRTSIAYTRLTASEAISQLHCRGFDEVQIPASSTMAVILNRMGYRLRKVLKAQPQKAVRPWRGSLA